MVAADARTAVALALSPGNAHDAPEGRKLLSGMEKPSNNPALLMDHAYEDNATRGVGDGSSLRTHFQAMGFPSTGDSIVVANWSPTC